MRFRTLSAAALMAASAGASAAPIGLISSITAPTLPILGTLVLPLPPLAVPDLPLLGPLLGTGGLPILGDLPGLLSRDKIPTLGLQLPPLAIPGLIPLPAVPIPVTDILAGLNAIPIAVSLLEALAPLATAVPLPVVSPLFENFDN